MSTEAANLFTQLIDSLWQVLDYLITFIREKIAGAFSQELSVFILAAISLFMAELIRKRKFVPGAGTEFMLITATAIFIILAYFDEVKKWVSMI